MKKVKHSLITFHGVMEKVSYNKGFYYLPKKEEDTDQKNKYKVGMTQGWH